VIVFGDTLVLAGIASSIGKARGRQVITHAQPVGLLLGVDAQVRENNSRNKENR
jgi:hypothetical protein